MEVMKIDASTVEKYQMILEKDPNSQVFAPLAEAYREMGMLSEAQKTVTAGVQRHPQFVGGLVTYAKIFRDLGHLGKALEALKKATSLAPENILAHQLLAEVELANKNPKDALKAFKMVLFLNPNSKSAQRAVQKLESLTADEYDEDVFAMTKLPEVLLDNPPTPTPRLQEKQDEMVVKPTPVTPNKALERMLSLIDAFIVRNDLEKAHALLKDTRIEFGDHPEIQRRMKTLQVRYNDSDEATPLRPLQPREKLIRERKLEVLEMMLRRIQDYRMQS
ncbi:tetratricopeptide repeat protein [Bdellovibrio sp. 22V]|uniref:tetratricopeptide repeat protein n=1 Tax=Bdellovibrio sp. 22V TaxID=3044166 RepID=UPI002543DF9B|nr:tetratricopeptide repeat protein [Bdellovibrio sp. 22V]WII73740.1 tetratricopeptide repeat protein [Bdellovibrio sp. 22V]